MIQVEERKSPQHNFPAEKFLGAKKLYLHLSQHTGKPSRLLVSLQDKVEEGDLIAQSDGLISASLCAPASGVIKAISNFNHPVLRKSTAVVLEPDGSASSYSINKDVVLFDKDTILDKIRNAGIVGMGGAAFPTYVKLKPPKPVDTLIINGCECEPYLACDYRLMVEKSDEIFKGVKLVSKVVSPKRVLFAIEENKPEAIKIFNRIISTQKYSIPSARVVILPSHYPQGGEKQLIWALTKRKVPLGGLPFDVGCIVHNVGTLYAIYEAVYCSKPLIERIVTFAGGALKKPKNILLKLGTTIKELFDSGVLEFKNEPAKIIYGGPMMGITLSGLDYPVMKGTSGILFLTKDEIDTKEEDACIHCARCVDSCPMGLLPLEFVKRVKNQEYSLLNELYIKDCIECGACSFSCPAKISLVHYIKIGKKYAVNS